MALSQVTNDGLAGIVPVSKGGTGSSNPAMALTNLGGKPAQAYVATSGAVTVSENLVNTTAGPITMTLPASPITGNAYEFIDAGLCFAINTLTLARNGNTIMGSATDLVCDVSGITFTLWFNGTDWRLL